MRGYTKGNGISQKPNGGKARRVQKTSNNPVKLEHEGIEDLNNYLWFMTLFMLPYMSVVVCVA